jgi:hypothetical protein
MKKTTLKLIKGLENLVEKFPEKKVIDVTKKTAKTTWKVYRKGHNIAMDYSSKLLNKLKF